MALRAAARGGRGLLPSSGNGAVDRALSRIRVDGAADGLVRRQVRDMDTRDEYECRLAERDLEIAKRDAEIAERSAEITKRDAEIAGTERRNNEARHGDCGTESARS